LCQSGSGIQVHFLPVIPTLSVSTIYGYFRVGLVSCFSFFYKLGLKLSKPIKSNPVNNRKSTVIQMTEVVKQHSIIAGKLT